MELQAAVLNQETFTTAFSMVTPARSLNAACAGTAFTFQLRVGVQPAGHVRCRQLC